MIHEGRSVVDVARQAGHAPTMTLDTYAHVFDEFDIEERISAEGADRASAGRDLGGGRAGAAAARRRMTRERPDTVAELRHAEGKLLVRDSCATPRACALQPRDVDVLGALGRYRFLTTVQIADLWWPGCALQVVRRRLAKLFAAGCVDRFRPQTIRGAYQWTTASHATATERPSRHASWSRAIASRRGASRYSTTATSSTTCG